MQKVRLEIVRMTYSQSQSGAYALILGEVGGTRRLPIIIGGFEAQAIALGLERIRQKRPLTHDLFMNFARFYGIELVEVVINKFREGVFFAILRCEKDGVISEIDARTSDAVALALRFQCPIYTYESILKEAGIVMDDEGSNIEPEESGEDDSPFSNYLLSELEELLQKAIENEEYERASQIRDEIQRRKKNQNL
ncbi:MAG: bifunctional nuclease family protein [Bacteroidetes bacterium]|nr:bifunctional nuclease family protein [Bacteroidota bacterium]